MRIFFFLCICMSSCIGTFAQSAADFQVGQLVLRDGETKNGLIAGQFQRNRGIWFKNAQNGSAVKFEMDQIKEVRIGDQERYVPYCPTDSAASGCQWVTTLVECQVSLHKITSGVSYYLLEEEDVFYPIKVQTLAGVVSALKNKCKGFNPQNKLYRYSSFSLIQMAIDYCQCKYPNQAEAKIYKDKSIQVHWGVQAGLNGGDLQLGENLFASRYFEGGGYKNRITPTVGLPIELQFGKHFSARTGLYFLQQTAIRDSVNIYFTFEPHFTQIKFSFSFLDLPFLVQYRFGQGNLQPFVQAGAHFGFVLAKSLTQNPYGNSTGFPIPEHRFTKFETGYTAGIGVNKMLSSKLRFQVIGQYSPYVVLFTHDIAAFKGNDGYRILLPQVQVTGGLMWKIGK